ncbi:MAG: DEAD/DEAH box helicase [Rubricoccaceae bacterium]|nr:DEAD/DEAH box helicase [Rubricoccaceae bacterium]
MSYQFTIDLTSEAQKHQKEEAGQEGGGYSPFPAPDPPLDEATVESLPAPLRDGVEAMGWPSLMPVQETAIPYLLDGRDLIVQSRTGSGKTGAFLLPLLERLDSEEPAAQCLVLCPTRELAKQIHGEFERMNGGRPKGERLDAVAVYGGTAYGPQIDAFKRGAALVIGTPGRVLDHLQRGTLKLDRLRVLVLDEADEMLSMGFYPDMRKLQRFLPRERQGAMFSATMPYAVQRVGREFLSEPSFLSLSGGTIHVDIMSHRAYAVEPMEKDRALVALIEMENPAAAIVFANTRREVDYLAQFLSNYGYDAAPISSDFNQKQREKVMGRLRRGDLRFLIATDVAARGIDVSDLSHVFQYDVPQDPEYYIHRAGRTARAGKTGVALTLYAPGEKAALQTIVKKYEIDMEWREVPTDEEVGGRTGERLTVLLEDEMRDKTNLERERLRRFVPVVQSLVAEGEPELLAMLLDEVYQRSLHRAPVAPLHEPEDDEEEHAEAQHDTAPEEG